MQRARSPHLVEFIGTFETNLEFCVVMEFCEGGSLEQLMDKIKQERKNMEESEIYKYLRMISIGLEVLHSFGITHRNLKPSNILLGRYHMVKIGDFGYSPKNFGYGNYMEKYLKTRPYMSPEIIQDSVINLMTDIWSLGVIIYNLFEGELPFQGKDDQELKRNILLKNMRKFQRDPSRVLKKLIYRMLSINSERRPTTKKILLKQEIVQMHSYVNQKEKQEKSHISNMNSLQIVEKWIMEINNGHKIKIKELMRQDLIQKIISMIQESNQFMENDKKNDSLLQPDDVIFKICELICQLISNDSEIISLIATSEIPKQLIRMLNILPIRHISISHIDVFNKLTANGSFEQNKQYFQLNAIQSLAPILRHQNEEIVDMAIQSLLEYGFVNGQTDNIKAYCSISLGMLNRTTKIPQTMKQGIINLLKNNIESKNNFFARQSTFALCSIALHKDNHLSIISEEFIDKIGIIIKTGNRIILGNILQLIIILIQNGNQETKNEIKLKIVEKDISQYLKDDDNYINRMGIKLIGWIKYENQMQQILQIRKLRRDIQEKDNIWEINKQIINQLEKLLIERNKIIEQFLIERNKLIEEEKRQTEVRMQDPINDEICEIICEIIKENEQGMNELMKSNILREIIRMFQILPIKCVNYIHSEMIQKLSEKSSIRQKQQLFSLGFISTLIPILDHNNLQIANNISIGIYNINIGGGTEKSFAVPSPFYHKLQLENKIDEIYKKGIIQQTTIEIQNRIAIVIAQLHQTLALPLKIREEVVKVLKNNIESKNNFFARQSTFALCSIALHKDNHLSIISEEFIDKIGIIVKTGNRIILGNILQLIIILIQNGNQETKNEIKLKIVEKDISQYVKDDDNYINRMGIKLIGWIKYEQQMQQILQIRKLRRDIQEKDNIWEINKQIINQLEKLLIERNKLIEEEKRQTEVRMQDPINDEICEIICEIIKENEQGMNELMKSNILREIIRMFQILPINYVKQIHTKTIMKLIISFQKDDIQSNFSLDAIRAIVPILIMPDNISHNIFESIFRICLTEKSKILDFEVHPYYIILQNEKIIDMIIQNGMQNWRDNLIQQETAILIGWLHQTQELLSNKKENIIFLLQNNVRIQNDIIQIHSLDALCSLAENLGNHSLIVANNFLSTISQIVQSEQKCLYENILRFMCIMLEKGTFIDRGQIYGLINDNLIENFTVDKNENIALKAIELYGWKNLREDMKKLQKKYYLFYNKEIWKKEDNVQKDVIIEIIEQCRQSIKRMDDKKQINQLKMLDPITITICKIMNIIMKSAQKSQQIIFQTLLPKEIIQMIKILPVSLIKSFQLNMLKQLVQVIKNEDKLLISDINIIIEQLLIERNKLIEEEKRQTEVRMQDPINDEICEIICEIIKENEQGMNELMKSNILREIIRMFQILPIKCVNYIHSEMIQKLSEKSSIRQKQQLFSLGFISTLIPILDHNNLQIANNISIGIYNINIGGGTEKSFAVPSPFYHKLQLENNIDEIYEKGIIQQTTIEIQNRIAIVIAQLHQTLALPLKIREEVVKVLKNNIESKNNFFARQSTFALCSIALHKDNHLSIISEEFIDKIGIIIKTGNRIILGNILQLIIILIQNGNEQIRNIIKRNILKEQIQKFTNTQEDNIAIQAKSLTKLL